MRLELARGQLSVGVALSCAGGTSLVGVTVEGPCLPRQ